MIATYALGAVMLAGLIVAVLVVRPRTSGDMPRVPRPGRLVAPACTIVAGNLLLVLSSGDVLGLLGLSVLVAGIVWLVAVARAGRSR